MKNRLLIVVVLGTQLLAHAVTVPTAPAGFCSNSNPAALTAINIVLTAFGLPPIAC